MKIYAPHYYKSFKCIADKCKHSCCKGWDVYLDEDTLDKYGLLGSPLGARIRKSLCEKEDGVCFKMKENGNCPFLNEKGLCDIILEKGDGFISEICREHPRFYNFFSHRTEAGLGLSCEEAARILLSETEPIKLTVIDSDATPEDEPWEEELFVLRKRNEVFQILQDRSIPLDDRIGRILSSCNANLPQKAPAEWAAVFVELERLDPLWENCLKALQSNPHISADAHEKFETAYENLLFYFIYRHVSSAEGKSDFSARIAFSCLSLHMIRLVLAALGTDSDLERLCDIARIYSAEIEYSEENTEKLIDLLY